MYKISFEPLQGPSKISAPFSVKKAPTFTDATPICPS